MQLRLHYPKDTEKAAETAADCRVLRQMGAERTTVGRCGMFAATYSDSASPFQVRIGKVEQHPI